MESVIKFDSSKSVSFAIETLTNGKYMFVVYTHGTPMNNGKQYDDLSTCFDAARDFMFDFLPKIRFLEISELWHNTK